MSSFWWSIRRSSVKCCAGIAIVALPVLIAAAGLDGFYKEINATFERMRLHVEHQCGRMITLGGRGPILLRHLMRGMQAGNFTPGFALVGSVTSLVPD